TQLHGDEGQGGTEIRGILRECRLLHAELDGVAVGGRMVGHPVQQLWRTGVERESALLAGGGGARQARGEVDVAGLVARCALVCEIGGEHSSTLGAQAQSVRVNAQGFVEIERHVSESGLYE